MVMKFRGHVQEACAHPGKVVEMDPATGGGETSGAEKMKIGNF